MESDTPQSATSSTGAPGVTSHSIKPPAVNPCGSCPYRRDVPSGVWDDSEYVKLPRYDAPTPEQPMGVFMCHQQDGRICAGWAGCHDMYESIAVRLASLNGSLTGDDLEALLNYTSGVPLFSSGQQAADHGRSEISSPGPKAKATIDKLTRRRVRRG